LINYYVCIKHPSAERLHGWVPAAAKGFSPAGELEGKSTGMGRFHPKIQRRTETHLTPQEKIPGLGC